MQVVCFGPGGKSVNGKAMLKSQLGNVKDPPTFRRLFLTHQISGAPDNCLLDQFLKGCYQTTSVSLLLGSEVKLTHLESQAHRFVPNVEIFIVQM